MKLIQKNPYRLIGILSNATTKEIQSRKGKITAYAKVGKEIASEYDFPVLNTIDRDQSKIEKAFSAIQQSKEMLDNSLFWFLKTNSFDETAINYLINDDKDKAIEIWEKVTFNKDVTSKNFSCFNNIGTLKLLGTTQIEIKEGIEAKLKLIESAYFTNFVHTVAGEAFVIDNQKQLEIFVNDLLNQLNGKYTNSETIKFFENCNDETKKYLNKKFTEEPLHNLESAIDSTKKKRNQNKINAFKLGLKLSENTAADLKLLKSLLGVNDLNYKMIADNLSKEIMQCAIEYFNESKENNSTEEYLENALRLNKIADSIAIGKLTKDRAKDHIATLEEIKDQELSEAIILLQSIKDLYIENERNIRQQIKHLKATDIEIISGYKTINHQAVEDSIKNSIEWQKVNDMLGTLLSDNNLKKIKECDKYEQKREFLELANWLKENSLRSSTIATIINKYKNIPPKLSFKILSSEVTNTDNKPLYNKFIRHIGLKLKIQVIEDKSVAFYIKYINPNGSVSRNAKTSPNKYTQSKIQSLVTGTQIIIFSGWGNSDKCTYEIGKHRIEVYIDDYMIHSKDFVVDLAPSEKLMIELKKAEENLKIVKNTQYLKSELLSVQNEMNKIKEWQFLRSKADRQMQINNQQQKINNIIQRADAEMNSNLIKQQSIITEIKSKIQKSEY